MPYCKTISYNKCMRSDVQLSSSGSCRQRFRTSKYSSRAPKNHGTQTMPSEKPILVRLTQSRTKSALLYCGTTLIPQAKKGMVIPRTVNNGLCNQSCSATASSMVVTKARTNRFASLLIRAYRRCSKLSVPCSSIKDLLVLLYDCVSVISVVKLQREHYTLALFLFFVKTK